MQRGKGKEVSVISLRESCLVLAKTCLNIKAGEEVLIIVDSNTKSIGGAIFTVCQELNAEPLLLEMLEREIHGQEPPSLVATAMRYADVVVAPTQKSLSHTDARRNATKEGVRIATMPGITEELMQRTLNVDYHQIAELSQEVAEKLTAGQKALLKSPGGTELTLFLQGRQGVADTGIIHEKGAFGNLPAGEAYIAPLEGKSNGIIVIDGEMAGIGTLDEPIVIEVENGFAEKISGGQSAEQLKAMLDKTQDKNSRNIGELGIGTNKMARLSGNLLEVEKVYGTVHIALGDSVSMGGSVRAPIHLDGVVLNPTLIIDDETILEAGKIL